MPNRTGFDFSDPAEDNILIGERQPRSVEAVDDLLSSLTLDKGDPYYVDVRGELLLGTPLSELRDIYVDKLADEDIEPLKARLGLVVSWLEEIVEDVE